LQHAFGKVDAEEETLSADPGQNMAEIISRAATKADNPVTRFQR
jgi:hypothetical protein